MHQVRLGYNDKIDATEQVDAEELIASLIRGRQENEIANCEANGIEDWSLTDEDCADLGRDILLAVLHRFRPDLVDSDQTPA